MAEASQRSTLVATSIVEHATALFDEEGFEQTRLADIAVAAGISRPTIYYYFKSKEDILVAMLWDLVAVDYVLAPLAETGLPTLDRLHALLRRIGHQVVEHPARIRIINRNFAQLPADVQADYTKYRRQLRHSVLDLISAAIGEGSMRPIDPSDATYMIMGALTSLPSWFPKDLSTKKAEARLDLLIGILLQGIVVPPENRHDGTLSGIVSRLREDLGYLDLLAAPEQAPPAVAKRKA